MLPAGDQDEMEVTEIVNKIIIVASSLLFILLYLNLLVDNCPIVISGFGRDAEEICAHLGFCAA